MSAASVLVLTYHSISDAPGPTSIPADTFGMQLDALQAQGYAAMTSQDFLAWREGDALGASRRVLITFDDGLLDFAETAFPLLHERGLPALVFLPTGKIGASDDWDGGGLRPLMDWDQVAELSRQGIEFGAHGRRHRDLTRISPEERRAEIVGSGEDIAARLGDFPRTFAAPYGRVNSAVQAEIAGAYPLAFGVRLDRAGRHGDPAAVPRIDMHYFRHPSRWRAFLDGDQSYFLARRALRAVRSLVRR